MKNDAQVRVFMERETTNKSREKLLGAAYNGLTKAVTQVVKLENESRRKKNERLRTLSPDEPMLDEIGFINLGDYELEKMMYGLPATPDPLPPGFSRLDHVLNHLPTLKKLPLGYQFATRLEELIDRYYNSVENTLRVLAKEKYTSSERALQLAKEWRLSWDSVSLDGRTKTDTLNWWKKEILIYLGFVENNWKADQVYG